MAEKGSKERGSGRKRVAPFGVQQSFSGTATRKVVGIYIYKHTINISTHQGAIFLLFEDKMTVLLPLHLACFCNCVDFDIDTLATICYNENTTTSNVYEGGLL